MNQKDVEKGLRESGLKEGDIVFVHSALSSLGHVEGGADTVVEAFLAVLGEEGTLVVPVWVGGAIPLTAGRRPDAVHSMAGWAKVAAIGAEAETICREHWKAETAHGEGTPYMALAELGGYICLLGVDNDRCTSFHSAESLLRLPYLREQAPKEVETPEGKMTCAVKFYPGPHRDFIGLDPMLRESGRMTMGRIGNSVVRLIKARDLVDLCVEAGRKDPAFALCHNPNCADCVQQRADLRRDLFSREDFTVVASGQLAGRYVPEMVENCRKAGIERIELDCLEGTPVDALTPDRLRKAVAQLRAESVDVVALRGRALTSAPGRLIQIAELCQIGRVVLPLSERSDEQAELARDKKVEVSFYNTHTDGAVTVQTLRDLSDGNRRPGFCFSAANFAKCGEHPFLGSYHKKLRCFLDQLDVEDCLFDGTPQPLAHGHAEVKEMISILRCSSFNGTMLIGPLNRCHGTLLDTTEQFVELLKSM